MWFLVLLLLAGCPTVDVLAPPDWWDGPGPGVSDDDDLSFGDDDDTPSGVDPDLAIVGVEVGGQMELRAYATDGSDPEVLDTLSLPTVLMASGRTLFALSGGTPSTITVASFQPDYTPNTNQLPPGADPSWFVLGKTCSVMVLAGTGSALVIPKQEQAQPFFVPLSGYADADGDPDALSGLRQGDRLFVGLSRLGDQGPDPEGGLAVEIDCEGNVVETQPLGPGGHLSAGAAEPQVHAVLVADGTVHDFDADADDWQGPPLWEDGGLDRLVVSDAGALWGTAGDRLLCKFGDAPPVEVGTDLGAVVDLAVAASGQACVVSEDRLSCWPAEGCEVDLPMVVDLDAPGRAVAVITGTK